MTDKYKLLSYSVLGVASVVLFCILILHLFTTVEPWIEYDFFLTGIAIGFVATAMTFAWMVQSFRRGRFVAGIFSAVILVLSGFLTFVNAHGWRDLYGARVALAPTANFLDLCNAARSGLHVATKDSPVVLVSVARFGQRVYRISAIGASGCSWSGVGGRKDREIQWSFKRRDPIVLKKSSIGDIENAYLEFLAKDSSIEDHHFLAIGWDSDFERWVIRKK